MVWSHVAIYGESSTSAREARSAWWNSIARLTPPAWVPASSTKVCGIRPMGRVVYLVPAFTIDDEELETLTTAVRRVIRASL